ncbi:MAG: methylated-DNA--[protein]-cysteine S-methyltransferase [Myxococcota bacterium]
MPIERTIAPGRDQAPNLGWGRFEAPGFGTLWLVWTSVGLRRLDFKRRDDLGANPSKLPSELSDSLHRYFDGQPEAFADVPLDLRGTDFQVRVWNALRRIGWGQVRTYGSIANDVGSPRAMRAVGQANHVNPISIIVPCHRVVEAGHHLGGYGGGPERKKRLLELEGVRLHEGIVQPGQMELF